MIPTDDTLEDTSDDAVPDTTEGDADIDVDAVVASALTAEGAYDVPDAESDDDDDDTDPPQLLTGGWLLHRAQSCRRGLSWQLEAPAGVDPVAWLSMTLQQRAVPNLGRLAGLGTYGLQAMGLEHELVVVVRTGRVQLRLHHQTPAPARLATAFALCEALLATDG